MSGTEGRRRPGRAPLGVGLALVLAVPAVVALLVLASPRWYPTFEMAQTELHVRDVASSHPPLVGLGGRIGTVERPGSHPGPISFWALWPLYQLFGGSAWALAAASMSLHLIAAAVALWIAHRRGGSPLALGMAALLAVLAHAYGMGRLIEPWNPYLPVLWWVVFLLAVWSVLDGDLPMLVVATFAGSFCAQTHIPYAGLVGGLAALAVAGATWSAYRRRTEPAERRRAVRCAIVAAALGVVLWAPPLVQQLSGAEGNLSIIRDHFSRPPEPPIGLRRAADVVLGHLDVRDLARARSTAEGPVAAGVLLVVAWGGSALAAARLRRRDLNRLNVVIAVALLLAVVVVSRIFGSVWDYLVLWVWGVAALMLLSLGQVVAALAGPRLTTTGYRPRASALGAMALFAVLGLFTTLLTLDAADAEPPAPKLSTLMARVVPPTVDALEGGSVPGGGRSGRYLVTWQDPVDIGAPGYGLLNELERRGFRVGVPRLFRAAVAPHRVLRPDEATAEVHVAVGVDISIWRGRPGAEEVAYADLRTPAEQREERRLRTGIILGLKQAERTDLLPLLDANLFQLATSPRLPPGLRLAVAEMGRLSQPTAVFVAPAGRA